MKVQDTKTPCCKNATGRWNGAHFVMTIANLTNASFFFHPDYTVGFGISPNQLLTQLMDFTTDSELHSTLKLDELLMTV